MEDLLVSYPVFLIAAASAEPQFVQAEQNSTYQPDRTKPI